MNSLNVFYQNQLVGKIIEDQLGMGFQYAADWLKYEKRFAISHSLPLSDQFYLEEGENFFANLLPEGGARDSLCQKLGISIDNDMALLERIGHECAGALVVAKTNAKKMPSEKKRQITEKDFARLLNNSVTVYSGLQDGENFPFSLAGAQDKIPIIYENGKFFRPTSSKVSTHILKFAQGRFGYVPENEIICALMLKSFDLPVPHSELVQLNSEYHFLIERYDRNAKAQVRFHQEDFCQMLGVSRKKKYENESGLNFKDIFFKIESIPESKNTTTDLDFLIRWQILNVFLGNCDGHLKNLSLLMDTNHKWSMAPFYDVVMTLIYPKISKRLALSIGGQYEIGNLHAKHWTTFFTELKVSPAFYLKKIAEIGDLIMPHFENVKQYFISEYGPSPVLEQMERQLLENIRRVNTGLRE